MFEQMPNWETSIIPLTIFILCNVVGVILSKFFFRKLDQLFEKISGIYYGVIINSLKGMPILWGLIIGSYSAIHVVALSAYWLHLLETFFLVIIVLSATIIIARIFSGVVKVYALTATGIFPTASILANLAEVSIYIIGMLVLLQDFGISITPMLTALGVGGLAVALALQDTLSNVIAGLHILISRQIQAGDYIKLSTGEEGNIIDISWRNTIIKALGNNMIIVPNQKIASAILTNYHLFNTELSISVAVSVSYDSDLEHVERVTLAVATEIMNEFTDGLEKFEPTVRFHTFGESSINFNVALRVKEFVDQYKMKHEFIKRLHKRYRQEEIEFPFPSRNIYTRTASKKPKTSQ
jgi:small-conductance mechanosensitive channel